MTRRDFFSFSGSRTLVAAAAAIGLPHIATHDDVPARLDIRTDHCHAGAQLEVFRNGRRVEFCVAYDLEAQTITRYRRGPDGRIAIVGNEWDYVVEHGGVSVRWKAAAT